MRGETNLFPGVCREELTHRHCIRALESLSQRTAVGSVSHIASMQGQGRTYARLKRIRHIVEENSRNKHPDFQILESFNDLVLFVMSILHTSLV